MFEGVEDSSLVALIEDATREEAAVGARRLAAVAELVSRRVGDDADDPRANWACDFWDSAAAEVAAAMNISHRKASGQMRIAETLRDHLPLVAGLFTRGRLSVRVVSAITWRTRLITDPAVWALIDDALVKRAEQWGPLSEDKLSAAVDALVFGFDPAAVILSREEARTRDFVVGKFDDEAGVASVWGKLLATDAAVLKKKVAAIAATVCDDDPRSAGERPADALGAFANGNTHLRCACTSPRCPARAEQPASKSSVIVNVYADQAAVAAAQSTVTAASPAPSTPTSAGTALLSGTEVMPTPLLAELLRNGAKLQPLCPPADEPESGYRPSAKVARFVRARDLTCRFPGCTMPAEFCDIDHVVPYPLGATHPSNLACLCRKHHHLKTFWTGDWELKLLPDGAAVWTSPTGRTYTTHPGCRSYFPDWDTNTGELPAPSKTETSSTERGVMMPLRKRTRAQDREARIKAEREQNDPDPPPF
ncbi:HNH endonuclease signature motif containing protein [Mycolicibacterium tusciae]|uniref:HNH endonuclease signature motif containing protein n=1 Tax=Mycolicibacterium tusciae TaxID=75922 RepID=UPI000487AFA5|nr:HNH endonuclease signature motif containing protein [Mycolicibacterium tusciae]